MRLQRVDNPFVDYINSLSEHQQVMKMLAESQLAVFFDRIFVNPYLILYIKLLFAIKLMSFSPVMPVMARQPLQISTGE